MDWQSEVKHTEEDWEESLATLYRALTARENYLCQDRTDIRFAVKEISRHMAKPRKVDWKALERLGKYARGRERWTQMSYSQSVKRKSNCY